MPSNIGYLNSTFKLWARIIKVKKNHSELLAGLNFQAQRNTCMCVRGESGLKSAFNLSRSYDRLQVGFDDVCGCRTPPRRKTHIAFTLIPCEVYTAAKHKHDQHNHNDVRLYLMSAYQALLIA